MRKFFQALSSIIIATLFSGALSAVSPLIVSAQPNDRPIVYAAGRLDVPGNYGIYKVNFDGSNETQIGVGRTPMLSPDGTKVAFINTTNGIVFNIFVVNIDGSNLMQLTSYDQSISYVPWQRLSWSPDGSKIAYTLSMGPYVKEGNPPQQIFVMNSDGTNKSNLTNATDSSYNYDQVWSPDGAHISFTKRIGNSASIYLMNPDGSNQRLIVSNSNSASWAPDGQRLVLMHGSSLGNVSVINSDGTNRVDLPFKVVYSPKWSPDGSRLLALAFCVDQCSSSGEEIATISPDGTNRTRVALPPTGQDIESAVWSPDSTMIVFGQNFALTTVSSTGVQTAGISRSDLAFNEFEWAYLPYVPNPTPSAPTNLTAPTPTNEDPDLSWDGVEGVTAYNIYRNGTQIDSSNTNSYTDNNASDGTYTYSITAVAGGNESAHSNSVEVVVDRTAPNVTGSSTTQPNVNGWYNHDVTINWNSTDQDPSSGAPTQPAPTLTSIEGDHTYTSDQSCDPANNCATGSLELMIDKRAPTISYSIQPDPRPGTVWNSGSVIVRFTCSDSESGIDTCPQPITVSTEGANQSVSGTATDRAGNSASVTTRPINIDLTSPVSHPTWNHDANSYGWNNSPTTVSFACSDNLSGVALCPSPVGESSEGIYNDLTATALDVAHNETITHFNIKIDETAPTVGSATWSANPVTLGTDATLNVPASDNLSGVRQGEYFVGTDPGVGNGSYMGYDSNAGSLTAAVGSNLGVGVYLVGYRSLDFADNWSATSYTMLVVTDTNTTLSMTGKNKKDLVPSLANGDVLPGLTSAGQTDAADFGFTVQYKNGALDPHNDFMFTYNTGAQCNSQHPNNCHSFMLNANSFDWLVVNGTNNSNGQSQGVATVTIDGVNTTNPFTLTGVDGGRLSPSVNDTITLKVFASGANPATATPIYQVSGSMPSANSVKIQ